MSGYVWGLEGEVRMHDYRIVGYTEAAFDDAYWGIRKRSLFSIRVY